MNTIIMNTFIQKKKGGLPLKEKHNLLKKLSDAEIERVIKKVEKIDKEIDEGTRKTITFEELLAERKTN